MENIDEMEAGPALDALIAEKVMGFTHVLDRSGAGCRWVCSVCNAKKYSTNISAAWEVVEKLKANGLIIQLWIQKETGGSPENECTIETFDYNGEYGKGSRWFAEAPTAPLAICRAALKAINS